jgi:hypothetical protein
MAMSPRKLTGQAQTFFGKLLWRGLAPLPTCSENSTGLVGTLRWGCAAIADRDLLLAKIVICCCQRLTA